MGMETVPVGGDDAGRLLAAVPQAQAERGHRRGVRAQIPNTPHSSAARRPPLEMR